MIELRTPGFAPVASDRAEGAGTLRIWGMASALPDYRYTQSELCRLLGYGEHRVARGIFENTAIDSRYLAVSPGELVRPMDARKQSETMVNLVPLAERAILALFAETGLDPASVDCFIFNTSSGFLMPAPSAILAARLGLRPDTVRYDLTSTGCVGAVPVLSLASDHLRAHPGHRVLSVCIDMGSVGLRPTDGQDKEQVVVNALFGDAAVAMLHGAGPACLDTPAMAMPEIVSIQYLQSQATLLNSAYIATDAAGLLTAHISKELPMRSAGLLLETLDTLLAKNEMTLADIRHWAFHPGGRAILDRLQADLNLTDTQMAPSRKALREVGNVGSPTCLMALQHLMAETPPASGDYGILAAIGPGLTVGLVLLRWP